MLLTHSKETLTNVTDLNNPKLSSSMQIFTKKLIFTHFFVIIMTTVALKFKFWIQICFELNSLGFLKSVAHVNASSEGDKSNSEQIEVIYSI